MPNIPYFYAFAILLVSKEMNHNQMDPQKAGQSDSDENVVPQTQTATLVKYFRMLKYL